MPFPAALVVQPAAAVLAVAAKAATGPVARRLTQRQTQKAFERALHRAATALDDTHPGWAHALFDESFFSNEAATILAQFLVRDGAPSPSELAVCWARSLNARDVAAGRRVREVEPIAAEFLDGLAAELKHEELLDPLNDQRALEFLSRAVNNIAVQLGGAKATYGTAVDYAQWMVARNLYLDSRGTLQTQRQVQLRLDDIYIALRAQRDETSSVIDRELIEQELSQFDATAVSEEERGELREALIARRSAPVGALDEHTGVRALSATDVAGENQCSVILGDPGSGKSTVLRHLALRAAQQLLGQMFAKNSAKPVSRLPILIRIAEYAENETWRRMSLTDYVSDYYRLHDCPAEGLTDLLHCTLQDGDCLVLLDGLDEIVRADDRLGIVQRIEEYVLRHREAGNRFVVTSRRAGYRNVPLQAPFVHYTIQDMSDEEIGQFIDKWCRAVEAAQTPDLPASVRDRVAQREINGIIAAVQTPGVRRLAANPLLLRILALIHRSGSSLPQKRVELYKLAAETLARTWRLAQGVPESALVKEEYLTRLLGAMGYWLHANRPSGIATERDVQQVLGSEWARINGLLWTDSQDSPDVLSEVRNFLEAVRIQTGLFVERAPRRYGFMHLTFEEYYVARYIVARRWNTAAIVRQHICDPRWEEPILLALGFVGLDYPEDAEELIAAAVLSRPRNGSTPDLRPSPLEETLGRDYLFALRCLGDQVPVAPSLLYELVDRLANELVRGAGSGKFMRYRELLDERAMSLPGSKAWPLLLERVASLTCDESAEVRAAALSWFIDYAGASSRSIRAAEDRIADDDELVRVRAATLLCMRGVDAQSLATLLNALNSRVSYIRTAALQGLERVSDVTKEVVTALAQAIGADESTDAYPTALSTLTRLSYKSPDALVQAIQPSRLTDRGLDDWRFDRLFGVGPEPTVPFLSALADYLTSPDAQLRESAAVAIGLVAYRARPPLDVGPIVEAALADPDSVVRLAALNAIGETRPRVAMPLPTVEVALTDASAAVRALAALLSRGVLDADDDGVARLIAALQRAVHDDDAQVRISALTALSAPPLADRAPWVPLILEATHDADPKVRGFVSGVLSRRGRALPEARAALEACFYDPSDHVRTAAAIACLGMEEFDSKTFPALVDAISQTENHGPAEAVTHLLLKGDERSLRFLDALIADTTALSRFFEGVCWGSLASTRFRLPILLWLLGHPRYDAREFAASQLNDFDQLEPHTSHPRWSTISFGGLSTPLLEGLQYGARDSDERVRLAAVHALALLDHRSPLVLRQLPRSLAVGSHSQKVVAASVLFRGDSRGAELVAVDAMASAADWVVRTEAANLMGRLDSANDDVVDALFIGFRDPNNDVRRACGRALAAIARRQAAWASAIEQRLLGAISDIGLADPDEVDGRSGNDYAFDALWALMAGDEPSRSDARLG